MDNKNKILTGVVIILSITIIAMGWSLMNDEGGDECPKCLVCENKTCPECSACPEPVKCSVCKNVTCPECPEQKECPEVKCPECEICKQCPNVTCPECPKRSGGSCSCPACVCPEPEPCNVSNVSECRNDTVADFEIELYLNGTPINEVRNGSYYYQNETIEAKIKPNRVIWTYANPPHWNNWYIYKYDAQNWIYIDYNKRMYCGLLCSDNITLCGAKMACAPSPNIVMLNCTNDWLLWNQTVYMAETINCTNASNQSVEWNCIEPKVAEEGKYLLSFCYRINYTYPINLDDRDCIYKEFEIKSCIIPHDDLYINEDTVLCPGTYNIVDSGFFGAIIINKSNVVLDCNGATLIGNGSGYGIYLYFNKANNTIKNCLISKFDIGIHLGSTSYNNVVINNIVNSNDKGIYSTLSSNNNNITNNIATNNIYGIALHYSQNNSITNNIATNNIYGIYLHYESNSNKISNNKISNNTQGIVMLPFCNSLSACIGNTDNTIRENEISNNSVGIYSNSSSSIINSNFVCKNVNLDFNSSDWQSSSGDNNTCNLSDGWNDQNTIGCTYNCTN